MFRKIMVHQKLLYFAHGDTECARERESIDSGANGGKRDRTAVMLLRQLQRCAIGAGEKVVLSVTPAAPARTYGMYHVTGGKVVSACHPCASCLAAAQHAAFCQQLRASRAVDRAINAASAQQGGIRGIDDGVNFHARDVATYASDPLVHDV